MKPAASLHLDIGHSQHPLNKNHSNIVNKIENEKRYSGSVVTATVVEVLGMGATLISVCMRLKVEDAIDSGSSSMNN